MKTKKRNIALKTNLIILFLLFLSICSAIEIKAQSPKARAYHQMAYDTESDQIVMYGGISIIGDPNALEFDTWVYDYNENIWAKMNGEQKPFSCITDGLAYDTESDKIITYGGIRKDHVASDQTWVYDYNENKWVDKNPTTNPGFREHHEIAYDLESDVIILFSGVIHRDYYPGDINIRYNDTWVYNYNDNTWENKTPSESPTGRHYYTMAYDSESDRTIIFSGINNNYELYVSEGKEYLTDTWAYDYNTNTWENLTKVGGPFTRAFSDMVYDSESDRIILFGGQHHMYEEKCVDETWAYDYNTNTWEQMHLECIAPHRHMHSMAYDSESDRVIVFGGIPETSRFDVSDETWAYDYNTDTWELMEKTNGTSFSLSSLLISLNIIVAILILKKRKKRNRRK